MKLIILDRDGVINHDSDTFIKSPEEWEPIPGSLDAIARLCKAGYRVVIATNQSGLSRGLFDVITLNAIHQKMHAAIRNAGGTVDAIFFCPHKATDNCDCRKPRQGMFQDIAHRYETTLENVPTIGDSLRDLQAGFLAGCTPILVRTGKGKMTQDNGGLPPGTIIYDNLADAVNHLLAPEQQATDPATTKKQTGK